MAKSMKGARAVSTQAEIRPSAVSTATSRRTSSRARMKSASVWRRSASRPPTVCWMRMACTTQSRSRISRRLAMRSRASTTGSPRRVSDTSRENSSDSGGSASSHIIWMARRNVWPADSDEAMRVRASGRAASNALRRLAIRCLTSDRRRSAGR